MDFNNGDHKRLCRLLGGRPDDNPISPLGGWPLIKAQLPMPRWKNPSEEPLGAILSPWAPSTTCCMCQGGGKILKVGVLLYLLLGFVCDNGMSNAEFTRCSSVRGNKFFAIFPLPPTFPRSIESSKRNIVEAELLR